MNSSKTRIKLINPEKRYFLHGILKRITLFSLPLLPESNMPRIADRFRGFLPVVVDVETGGFNAKTDAILEIAACILCMDDFGRLKIAETISANIEPFQGSRI